MSTAPENRAVLEPELERRVKALNVACALHPEFTLPLLQAYCGIFEWELAVILADERLAPFIQHVGDTYRIINLNGLRDYARNLAGA